MSTNDASDGMKRRDFMIASAAGIAAVSLPFPGAVLGKEAAGTPISLPPLPYPEDALEPYLSKFTIRITTSTTAVISTSLLK